MYCLEPADSAAGTVSLTDMPLEYLPAGGWQAITAPPMIKVCSSDLTLQLFPGLVTAKAVWPGLLAAELGWGSTPMEAAMAAVTQFGASSAKAAPAAYITNEAVRASAAAAEPSLESTRGSTPYRRTTS